MGRRPFRAVALLAAYNEERFIAACLEHLLGQGLEVHLIDNGSTDETVSQARAFLGRGLIEIESLPRGEEFSLTAILNRKEALAQTIDADWFIHHDADEFRGTHCSDTTLGDALAQADAEGFNAVNFLEFAFVPTVEAPDHDHRDFQCTMRHYYPYLPTFPHRLNAWKRQPGPVALARSAGHRVTFPGLRVFPTALWMRHYLFLSADHAREKYIGRIRAPAEQRLGWGGWRIAVALGTDEAPQLPRQSELRKYVDDRSLDPAQPLTEHVWAREWALRVTGRRSPAQLTEQAGGPSGRRRS